MRIDLLNESQEKRINKAADYILNRFESNPYALVFKGSAILHDDAEDIDVLILTDKPFTHKIGSKEYVRKDMMQILRREDNTGHDYFDITFMNPKELEERVLSMHTDSFERVAFTDLAYHITVGKDFLKPLEKKMYQMMFDDFLQYTAASVHDGEVHASPQSLLMYPLMLDLRRISTIAKSAYRFMSSENIQINGEQIINEFIDAIIFPEGVEITDYGIKIDTAALQKKVRTEAVPDITHTYEKEFPDRYDVIFKDAPHLPDFSAITHFKKKDGRVYYAPQIRKLINAYAR